MEKLTGYSSVVPLECPLREPPPRKNSWCVSFPGYSPI